MTCLANYDCKPIESSRQKMQSIDSLGISCSPWRRNTARMSSLTTRKKIRAYRKHNYDDVVVPLFQRSIFPHSLHFTIFISDILPFLTKKICSAFALSFSSTDTRIRRCFIFFSSQESWGSKPYRNRKMVEENGIGGSTLEISHSETNDIEFIIMNDKICIWIGA